MDADELAISRQIRDFVHRYLAQNDYFTPQADRENEDAEGEELTVLYLTAAGVGKDGLHLTFEHGESVDLGKHDPKACAEKVTQEVKKQFPDIVKRYLVSFEVNAPV